MTTAMVRKSGETSTAQIPRSTVLLVEDEADVRSLMALHLKRDGFDVVETRDGESALELLEKGGIDLAVLDWMLPGLSGYELCRAFRGRVPILMVTARTDPQDIAAALDAGADDYVTKPFQVLVFLARVKALLRRAVAQRATPSRRFEVGGLSLDVDNYQVFCEGSEIKLTPSEFKALHALLENEGRILSRQKLMLRIQGEGVTVTERAIDTLVFGLRKTLGPCASLVETVRGVGYRLRQPEALS